MRTFRASCPYLFVPAISALLGCGARTPLDGAACRPIEALEDPGSCEGDWTETPPHVLTTEAPGAVLAAGCDSVYVVAGGSVHRSSDGGATFGAPVELPEDVGGPYVGSSRWQSAAATKGGFLYLAGRRDGALVVYHGDGSTWSERGTLAASTPWLASANILARREDDVALWWLEGPAPLGFFAARSTDGGRNFGVPLAVTDDTMTTHTYGSVCLAGANAIAAAFFSCNSLDCTGDDSGVSLRAGFGALSVDNGPFQRTEIFRREDDWAGFPPAPVVGCHESGAVVVAWPTGPSGAFAAAAEPCAPLTLRGGSNWEQGTSCCEPYDMDIAVSETRALVKWVEGSGGGSGFLVMNLAGELAGPPLDVGDLDSDGVTDIVADACALPGDRFAAITRRDKYSVPGKGGQSLALWIDRTGAITEMRPLGPSDSQLISPHVACDRRGRAHFVWSDQGTWIASL